MSTAHNAPEEAEWSVPPEKTPLRLEVTELAEFCRRRPFADAAEAAAEVFVIPGELMLARLRFLTRPPSLEGKSNDVGDGGTLPVLEPAAEK